MGQQNSSAQVGKGNQENDCMLNESINRELSLAKKNDISESIQCVRARIDMLIEDCLTGNETLHGVSNTISSNGCCINNINDTSHSQCEVGNEKFVGAIENMRGKMRSGYESKETNIILENKEPKQMLESKQKELETSYETKIDNKESLDKCGVENDLKFYKDEKEAYLPAEKRTQIKKPHLVVSDLISDMVSTEITQNHLAQLQKRTVTTFNTFIDKVLDSSLKMEFMDKPKPTNIQILGSETHVTSDCVNSEIRKSPNGAVKTEKKNITLQDHIETVLEESFQDESTLLTRNYNIYSKVIEQEKLNAHGLVNDLIAQGLVASKQNIEAKQVVNHTNKDNVDVNSNMSHTFQNKIAKENLEQSPKSGVDEKLKFRSVNPNNVCVGKSASASSNNVCVINERISMHSETSCNVSDQQYRDVQHKKDRAVNEESCYIKDKLLQGNSKSCLRSLLNSQSQSCETSGSDSVLQLSLQIASDSIHNASFYKNHDQGSPNHMHEMRNTLCDGKQIIHIKHCQCALCVLPCSSNVLEMPMSGHYGSGKLSPNFPQHTSCPMLVQSTQSQMNSMLPAMMRPTHGIPQGYICNQGMPQHLSHHQPIVSSKVNFEKSLRTKDSSKVCLETDFMQEKSNMQRSYLVEEECFSNNDSQSGSSDCSLETPLDLTVVKYTKSELMQQLSMTQRKIMTPNVFIKHIENNVDRHCLGLAQHRTQHSRSATLYDSKNLASTLSPNSTCSASSFSTLHARMLPSPYLTGGMTSKQPLVDSTLPVLQRLAEHHHEDVLLTGPLLDQQQHQIQAQFSVNHSDFGTNEKHLLNNISKHEPIQNIIGHHDQNDILYLICRLCTQTYGSPYGFRKHFRNQHGFEPQAEHTIVQTISATKSVLHSPHNHLGSPVIQEDEVTFHRNVSPQSSCSEQKNHNFDIPLQRKSISLSPPGFNGKNVELITECNRSETKCLECPECSKSFQLNDFGSYKRHCRQHGNLKMNGPSTCSACHLPFPDQKLLKEHYLAHAEDSLGMKQDRTSDEKSLKPCSSLMCYSCLECDQQFDDLCAFNQHKASHDLQVKQLESRKVVKIIKQSSPGIVQEEIEKDGQVNFVMSDRIVVHAAEAWTSLAYPYSSCDNNKNKMFDENFDEVGQKRGVKNCSNVDTGNKDSEKTLAQESTLNCNSNNSDSKFSDETEFMYKHKKFFHHCKRTPTISSNDLSEVTNSKICKVIDGTWGDNLAQVIGSALSDNNCDSSNGANWK